MTIYGTYTIELGACGTCDHFMIEEVDYPIFVKMDCKELRIPEGYAPPAMLCAAKGGIRPCSYSESCPEYRSGGE